MLLFLCYLLPWMLAKIDDATKFELTPEMQAELKELMKKVRELPCFVVTCLEPPCRTRESIGWLNQPRTSYFARARRRNAASIHRSLR